MSPFPPKSKNGVIHLSFVQSEARIGPVPIVLNRDSSHWPPFHSPNLLAQGYKKVAPFCFFSFLFSLQIPNEHSRKYTSQPQKRLLFSVLLTSKPHTTTNLPQTTHLYSFTMVQATNLGYPRIVSGPLPLFFVHILSFSRRCALYA